MSKVIKLDDCLKAYDYALHDWEVAAWNVYGSLQDYITPRHRWDYRTEFSVNGRDFREWNHADLWDLVVLGGLAIGAGSPIWVTRRSNPFAMHGPYRLALRQNLERELSLLALSQAKARKSGFWTSDGRDINRLNLRIPHK